MCANSKNFSHKNTQRLGAFPLVLLQCVSKVMLLCIRQGRPFYKSSMNSFLFITQSLLLALFLLPGSTLAKPPIRGIVVDEQGVPLHGVQIVACYDGWGFSFGQLVWDKQFCSPPVLTASDGHYQIDFKRAMRVIARKEGWSQTQDAHPHTSLIVLTPAALYRQRLAQQTQRLRAEQLARTPNESDTDYYCRTIVEHLRPISVHYLQDKMDIFPKLLFSSSGTLFAFRAAEPLRQHFASQVKIFHQGKELHAPLTLLSSQGICNVSFLQIPPEFSQTQPLELFIPQSQALVELNHH